MRTGSAIARAATIAVLVVGSTTGCAAGSGQTPDSTSSASPARTGRPASSTRTTFIPERVVLPGGSSAGVRPASTVDGELKVPENVRHVGWWDGSALVGDPYGSTVIAGHVDSASGGLGFFSRLLSIKKGERVTLRSGSHSLVYRIVSVKSVSRTRLATTSAVLDQSGEHRMVLITCTGTFRPGRGYDRNLVVIGKPLGLAQ